MIEKHLLCPERVRRVPAYFGIAHRVPEEAFLHLTEDSPIRTALRQRVKTVLERVTVNPEPGS